MADTEFLAAAFEEHRAHLRAVAYRLLGSMTDADDAVQDTWLRLSRSDATEVENLGGWLTTVVARVALNMLRSRRYRREEPIGDSGADGADGAVGAPDPELEAVLADSVGLALLVVLDTLTPAERLAFVLHDLLAMPFAEVANVLGRSTEATRQLASRARRRVRATPSPHHAGDLARQREAASAFLAASRGGDFAALIAVLDSDVVLTGDAGSSPSGRPVTLRGAETVARGAVMSGGRAESSQLALVDGAVGVLYAPAGQLQVVLALTVSGSRISAIDVITDPDRLRRLDLAVLPDWKATRRTRRHPPAGLAAPTRRTGRRRPAGLAGPARGPKRLMTPPPVEKEQFGMLCQHPGPLEVARAVQAGHKPLLPGTVRMGLAKSPQACSKVCLT